MPRVALLVRAGELDRPEARVACATEPVDPRKDFGRDFVELLPGRRVVDLRRGQVVLVAFLDHAEVPAGKRSTRSSRSNWWPSSHAFTVTIGSVPC